MWHTVEEAAIFDEVWEEEDNEVPEPSSKRIKAKAKSLKEKGVVKCPITQGA